MDDGTGGLQIGTSVDIKRTDGRVHSAVVSGINWDTKSVTVEWFERGETKGKEIEMEAILKLNPDLGVASDNVSVIPTKLSRGQGVLPSHNDLAVGGDGPDYLDDFDDEDDDECLDDNDVFADQQHSNTTTTSTSTLPMRTTAAKPYVTRPTIDSVGNIKGSQRQPRQSYVRPPQGSVSSVQSTQNGHSDQSLTGVENIPPGSQQCPPTATSAPGNRASAMAANRRKGNVVKEVEKLKRNREERRQRQLELKVEKEAMMNVDPGNPNWEFLAMIKDYRSNLEFKPLKDSDTVEDHQITVCVRKRPLNKKETSRKEVDVISVPNKDQIIVHEPKNKVDLTKYLENQHFRFDYAFDESCNNEIVYKYTARPLVQTVFEGGMATCFAYGQTGSGKTHTMGGDFLGKTQDCKKGIYAMAAKDIFKYLKSAKFKHLSITVSASFFEIYSGKVFDLLANKAKLRVLEDGRQQVQVVGLTEKTVEGVDDVLKLIQHGNAARTSGQTSANSNSSRSHAVFQIILRQNSNNRVHGKFSLIDLAGNERGADTSSANRQTRMEGAEINKSLLALKECIRALGRKGAHLPFRASKLTQVLRDSFMGEKSKTCMIAMISPGMSSCEHSLNTLRYADRVKELAAQDPLEMKNSPTEEPMKIEDGEMDDTHDSDLAQLRSLNEGELSADMYNFHNAVSQLQILEDEVLDSHKVFRDSLVRWLDINNSYLAMTNEVDYDQDAYAQQMDTFLHEMKGAVGQFHDRVGYFKSQLALEEQMSRNMKRPFQH